MPAPTGRWRVPWCVTAVRCTGCSPIPVLHFGDLTASSVSTSKAIWFSSLEATYRGFDNPGHLQLIKKLQNNVLNRPRANNTSDRLTHQHPASLHDLGNEFYELWLDTEAMQYTCAYFPDADMTIEQAQAAMLDHICRKLQLKPGDRVVEAGCGWGGLRATWRATTASRCGPSISRINKFCTRAPRQRHRDWRTAEYVEDDYRNIAGEYDAFVSIGMFEHVGPSHYRALANVLDRASRPPAAA